MGVSSEEPQSSFAPKSFPPSFTRSRRVQKLFVSNILLKTRAPKLGVDDYGMNYETLIIANLLSTQVTNEI